MKVTELMIGDYFKFPIGIEKVQELFTYQQGSYLTWFAASATLIPTKVDYLEPIPLTSEILGKNGFVANTHVYPYPYYEYINEENKLKIGFAFPQGNKTSYKEPWVYIDSEYVFIEHLPCIYIHQLQHVLKLCGIEKNIKL